MPDIFARAFKQQRDVVLHPSRRKAIFCTRRSAKSYTMGLGLVHGALESPGSKGLFIGLTRMSAKGIVWKDVLQTINYDFNLGADFNIADLTMTLPNGSIIYITGVDADESEMNKLLGQKYKTVAIDEASMYTIDQRNLVYGILGPAMTDLDGTIYMGGTASDFPRGLFFDITTGVERGWELFQWTAHDNPYVSKQWQQALDDIARERPLYMETPQFKQWFLNQWVIDEEKLVYRFNPSRNLVKDLPKLQPDGWSYVLGVDTGWEDDNAFVLTAFHANDPRLYVTRSYRRKRMSFDEVADKIREFCADPVMAPHKIFIDGANKQGVESMRQRSAIPFQYADKQDKATFIELCNADMIQGRVLVVDCPENRPLWEQMAALVWVTDGGKIKIPKKEHPSLPNHDCDAFLYAWRNGFHYHWAPQEQKIPIYSPAWYEKQSEQIWERERERLENEGQQTLWPDDLI